MSQAPYSGGLWNLHGNGQFLSLLLAHTYNLPAQIAHAKTMPEPAACRCTPRRLDLKARVPHWIQLWGWKSGLQPFHAFNASAPLQKCKSTWKTFKYPFCSNTSMATGYSWHTLNQFYTTSLSWSPENPVSQGKEPMERPSLNFSQEHPLTRIF